MLGDPVMEKSVERVEEGPEIPEEKKDTYTDPVIGTSAKRRRSSLSSDGGEDAATPSSSRMAVQLGSLHKRRASASPEKFNKGRFEPLPIQTDVSNGPPLKKPRLGYETNLEITYDSTGTPRIASFVSEFKSIDKKAAVANDVTRAASVTFPESLSDDIMLATSIVASYQINNSRSPQEATKKRFSLLHSICRDNDLLLLLVSYLTIPSLISLYAISKPFHFLFNRHHTAFILSCMRTWAPNAEKVFPWRCYKSLCVKDPSKRQKVRLEGREDEVKRRWDDLRDVPSLRWLQMVVWREGVCRDILIQLATKGLRCPPGTLDSIKRMWFLLDLPLNAHRIALIRNPEYMTDGVLHGITFFLLKLDMHFTDPVQPAYPVNHPNQRLYPDRWAGGTPSGVPLRKMLLAERQLTPLWRVLRGWSWDPTDPQRPMTRTDILRLWIRHKYTPPEDTPENVKKMSIMGIPWWEVGAAGLERTGVSFHNVGDKQVALAHPSIAGTGGMASHLKQQILYPHRRQITLEYEKPRERLLRPDELVAREGIRRKLSMHKKWALMMFWGFCDELGYEYPIWTEAEYLRMHKGLPPRPLVKKDEKARNADGESGMTEGGKTDAERRKPSGAEERPSTATNAAV